MTSYEDAVAELFAAAHAAFVAERKRLAAVLKTEGQAEAAARLTKLPRPPISAWAVNQLWRRERDLFEALIASAARVATGDRDAAADHRELTTRLRARAATLLAEAGNAAAEATLRRVTTSLAAIAAAGGFAPDPEGALTADRDPPGFESMGGFAAAAAEHATAPPAPPTEPAAHAELARLEAERRRRAAEEKQRAEAAAEERRRKQELERRRAEHERLTAVHRAAVRDLELKRRERDRLRQAADEAEREVEKLQARVADLAAQLAGES
jgi:hypothetical protein